MKTRAALLLAASALAFGDVDIWLRRAATDAEMERLLHSVSDPASAEFGAFPPRAALAEATGAPSSAVAAVSEYLRTVEGVPGRSIVASPMNDFITVRGRDALREAMPPSVKALVALVHEEEKAGTAKSATSRGHRRSRLRVGEAAAASPFGAPDVRQAWGVPAGAVGAGEAQLVWGPGSYDVNVAEVQKYWQHFGVNGSTARLLFEGYAHGNQTAGDNYGEASLDADIITGMAPGATTTVSNTNNTSPPEEGPGFGYAQLAFLRQLAAQDTLPGVVSLSLGSLTWRSCDMLCRRAVESGVSNYTACLEFVQYDQRQVCMFQNDEVIQLANQQFMLLGSRGVTVLAAAGDGGMHFSFEAFSVATELGRKLNGIACSLAMPTFPASSPHVTAVGGTQWTGQGTKDAPVYWNGGGSGFSWESAMPSYQAAVVKAYLESAKSDPEFPEADAFNASLRAYPDISALAGDVGMVYQGSLVTSGGTSAATPTMAGFVTLLNEQRVAAKKKRFGFMNIALYQMAAQHADEMFFDVVVGNSKCTSSSCLACTKGFPATKGFDLATGWGAPRWEGMVKYLVNELP